MSIIPFYGNKNMTKYLNNNDDNARKSSQVY